MSRIVLKQEIENLIEKGKTEREIAKELNISGTELYYAKKYLGISKRRRGKTKTFIKELEDKFGQNFETIVRTFYCGGTIKDFARKLSKRMGYKVLPTTLYNSLRENNIFESSFIEFKNKEEQ